MIFRFDKLLTSEPLSFSNFVKNEFFQGMKIRKSSVLFLFTVWSTGIFWAQPPAEPLINGNVKFVLEESFGASMGRAGLEISEKDRQISWINDNKMEFDENNNLIKRTFYDDYQNFMHQEAYHYSNKKLKSRIISSFNYTYDYTQNGLLSLEMVAPKNDSLSKKIKFKYGYDSKGNLSDIWEYDYQGGYICHQELSYNSAGKITLEKLNYSDGIEKKIYTYNPQNELIKLEWFANSNQLIERTTFAYSNGKRISEFWEGMDGNKVETTLLKEFDIFGNPIKITEIDKKRQINDVEIIEYEFDKHNNWIRKTTSINNSRFYIVVRRIAYY